MGLRITKVLDMGHYFGFKKRDLTRFSKKSLDLSDVYIYCKAMPHRVAKTWVQYISTSNATKCTNKS